MADDLDAELLALAGDSEEETSPQGKQAAESPARSQSRSPDPSAMSRKGSGKTPRRGRKSKRDEEDGEVYVLHAASAFSPFRLGCLQEIN